MTESKRGDNDARLCVRIPRELMDAVERKAPKTCVSVSEFVRKVLADAVRK